MIHCKKLSHLASGMMGGFEVASFNERLPVKLSFVFFAAKTIRNLDVVDTGKGIHFLQENNPHLIAEKLEEWLARLPAKTSAAKCSV